MNKKEQLIVDLIHQYGMIDGAHHKQWLLDQVLHIILGAKYDEWLNEMNSETDNEGNKYEDWDIGIAP